MNEFVMKLRILMRSEMTLFKADAQRRSNSATMMALAVGCVIVALIFLNVGAFFVLTDADIDSRAAFILAGANLAIALIPFSLSRRAKPGPEELMVREIREMALTEISKDVEGVAEQVSAVGSSINQVRSGIATFGGGGGLGGIGGLGPALGLVIDLLKKSKK